MTRIKSEAPLSLSQANIILSIDVVFVVARRDHRNDSGTLDRLENELRLYFDSRFPAGDDDYDWEISRPICQDCGEKALPGYVAGDRCERLAKRNGCVPETVCGGRLDMLPLDITDIERCPCCNAPSDEWETFLKRGG